MKLEITHPSAPKNDLLPLLPLQNILLVQRQMSVKERDVEQFQQALKIYTDSTCSQPNNLQYVPLSDAVPLFASVFHAAQFDANCFTFPQNNSLYSFCLSPLSVSLSPCLFIFSISVQNLPDRSCFIMYEFWQDRLSWMR